MGAHTLQHRHIEDTMSSSSGDSGTNLSKRIPKQGAMRPSKKEGEGAMTPSKKEGEGAMRPSKKKGEGKKSPYTRPQSAESKDSSKQGSGSNQKKKQDKKEQLVCAAQIVLQQRRDGESAAKPISLSSGDGTHTLDLDTEPQPLSSAAKRKMEQEAIVTTLKETIARCDGDNVASQVELATFAITYKTCNTLTQKAIDKAFEKKLYLLPFFKVVWAARPLVQLHVNSLKAKGGEIDEANASIHAMIDIALLTLGQVTIASQGERILQAKVDEGAAKISNMEDKICTLEDENATLKKKLKEFKEDLRAASTKLDNQVSKDALVRRDKTIKRLSEENTQLKQAQQLVDTLIAAIEDHDALAPRHMRFLNRDEDEGVDAEEGVEEDEKMEEEDEKMEEEDEKMEEEEKMEEDDESSDDNSSPSDDDDME